AGEQDDGVDAADKDVEARARRLEFARVPAPVGRKADEQSAEDQRLSREKNPHPQRVSRALLLDVVELVGHVGVAQRLTRQGLLLPRWNTRRAPGQRWA